MNQAAKARLVKKQLEQHIAATKALQERAAELADIIPSPSPSPHDISVPWLLTPRLGERMPQLRLTQHRQRLSASRKAEAWALSPTDSSSPPPPADAMHSIVPASGRSPAWVRESLLSADDPSRDGAPGPGPSASGASSGKRSPASAYDPDEYDIPPTRAELEAIVRSCSDLEALRKTYAAHGRGLDRQGLLLFVSQLASFSDPGVMSVRLWTASQAMLVQLLQRVTTSLDDMNMTEFVIMLGAVSRLRYVPPTDWVQAVMTQMKPRLYNASPSHLTTTLRAIARLALNPNDVKGVAVWESWMKRYLSAVARQVDDYRADELVKTLVALSELRFRPPPEWMARFSGALYSKLDALDAHSLSETMLAFAAMRYQPEAPFMRAYYSQLYSRLPLADDRDLATYAQAISLLDRLARHEFMQDFLGEVVQKLSTFKPQQLANLLNAMGRLAVQPVGLNTQPVRLRPPQGWTDAVAAHCSEPRRLKAFSGSALASMAWGLSVLGHRASPQFMDDLLSASYGKLHTCGPTDHILLLTALGNFGFRPIRGREGLWDTWLTEIEKLTARRTHDVRGVCDLMAALARLPRPPSTDGSFKPRPPHPDMISGVLKSLHIRNMKNTSPARLAALAGSLATLQVRLDYGSLYYFAQSARFMWSGFSAHDYALLLSSLVHIGTPGASDPRWAGDFLAIIMCRLPDFDGPSLAATLDAIRRLPKPEFEPSRQWLAAAANRAVELVRSPPQPQALVAAGGAGTALVQQPGPVSFPLSIRPDGSRVGVGGVAPSPDGRLVPLPVMQPLTPDHMVVLARSLAALGHRVGDPSEPLVRIIRGLLARNAALWELQEQAQAQADGSMTPAAVAAAVAPSGRDTGAVAPGAAAGAHPAPHVPPAGEVQRPKPLLTRKAAAVLEVSLRVMLGEEVEAEARQAALLEEAGSSKAAARGPAAASGGRSGAPSTGPQGDQATWYALPRNAFQKQAEDSRAQQQIRGRRKQGTEQGQRGPEDASRRGGGGNGAGREHTRRVHSPQAPITTSESLEGTSTASTSLSSPPSLASPPATETAAPFSPSSWSTFSFATGSPPASGSSDASGGAASSEPASPAPRPAGAAPRVRGRKAVREFTVRAYGR